MMASCDEHDIELARQAQGSHVADQVFAAGVSARLTASMSGERSVNEIEVCCQMRGQASPSTSERSVTSESTPAALAALAGFGIGHYSWRRR
jgi:hypothetical protein